MFHTPRDELPDLRSSIRAGTAALLSHNVVEAPIQHEALCQSVFLGIEEKGVEFPVSQRGLEILAQLRKGIPGYRHSSSRHGLNDK